MRLKKGVAKLQERQRVLAIEALAHGIKCQQTVDREVTADVIQKLQVADLVEPFGVIHDLAGCLFQGEVALEGAGDASNVRVDLLVREHRAALVTETRIADACGRATDQQDRAVPGLLQPAHQHQALEMADVQAVSRSVEAQVDRPRAACQVRAKPFEVGGLVNETATGKGLDQIRVSGHRVYPEARCSERCALHTNGS